MFSKIKISCWVMIKLDEPHWIIESHHIGNQTPCERCDPATPSSLAHELK